MARFLFTMLPANDLSGDKPVIWVYSGNPRYAGVPMPFDSIVVIRAAIAALADAQEAAGRIEQFAADGVRHL